LVSGRKAEREAIQNESADLSLLIREFADQKSMPTLLWVQPPDFDRPGVNSDGNFGNDPKF
jgi:hypothetical protein